MVDIGFNYRITDFQCALGSNQLKKLKQFVLKRRKKMLTHTKIIYSNIVNIKTPSQGHNIDMLFIFIHSDCLFLNIKLILSTKIDKKNAFLKNYLGIK